MDHYPCFTIEHPNTIVYGAIPDQPTVVSATRQVVFTRYRAERVDQKPEHSIIYENTDDLLEPARLCAQKILANECEYFVAAHTKRGPVRVVDRQTFEAAKWAKFTQVISTQS